MTCAFISPQSIYRGCTPSVSGLSGRNYNPRPRGCSRVLPAGVEVIHFKNESMVSLVLRQYMRGENVLLIQIGKQNVKIIEK